MNNRINIHDENFLKVHPDLAALFSEIEEKEKTIRKLKLKKKLLKEEVKTAKNELEKRLKSLETWETQGATAPKRNSQRAQGSR